MSGTTKASLCHVTWPMDLDFEVSCVLSAISCTSKMLFKELFQPGEELLQGHSI